MRVIVRLMGIACLVAVVSATDVHAQFQQTGSVYSRFGIGERQSFHSSQIAAMGGGGYALSSGRYKTFSNPASWSNQVLTGIAGGYSYQGLRAEDATSEANEIASGSLNSIQFGFPIMAQKLGVGLSFAPYSRVGYQIRVEDVIDGGLSPGDTSAYSIDYLGNGGLHSFTAGLGFAPSPRFSVGVSGQLIFGLIEESRETDFVDSDFATTILTESSQLSGYRATIGFQGNLRNVATEADRLSAGLIVTTPANLTGSRTNLFGTTQDRDTLGTGIDVDMTLPVEVAAGLAYTFDARWLMALDASYEPWTNFESNVGVPGYMPGDTGTLRDRIRLSGGIEVLPAGSDLFADYFERVAYRIGFFYDQGYVKPDGINTVNSYGITGGLSLPLGVPGTRVDVITEVGRRGSTENGLVRDTFFKFGLNLNIGERWFVKRKLG